MRKLITTASALTFFALFGMGGICGDMPSSDWNVSGSDETETFTFDTDGETRSWRITVTASADAFPSETPQSNVSVYVEPEDYQNIPEGDARADFELAAEDDPDTVLASGHLAYQGSDYSERAGCSIDDALADCDGTAECTMTYVLTGTYTGTMAMDDLWVLAEASITVEVTDEDVPDGASVTVTIEELP